jgi:hypothetical protein
VRIAAPRRQKGVTLFVTLIMLVVLTLFALSAFNLSSVNLKIVGNYQQQKESEALVSQTLERVMSTVTMLHHAGGDLPAERRDAERHAAQLARAPRRRAGREAALQLHGARQGLHQEDRRV